MVTGTIPVSGIHASILFDSDATHSFISTTFIRQHDIGCEPMKTKLYVETPVGGILSTESVCKSCSIKIGERELPTDLVVLDMHDFDVILGMDWLATYHASVDCHGKRVNFHIPREITFSFDGSTGTTPPRIISPEQARQMIRKGCRGYLVSIKNKEHDELKLQDIPIINEFSDVFIDDLSDYHQIEKLNLLLSWHPIPVRFLKLLTEWPLWS